MLHVQTLDALKNYENVHVSKLISISVVISGLTASRKEAGRGFVSVYCSLLQDRKDVSVGFVGFLLIAVSSMKSPHI